MFVTHIITFIFPDIAQIIILSGIQDVVLASYLKVKQKPCENTLVFLGDCYVHGYACLNGKKHI